MSNNTNPSPKPRKAGGATDPNKCTAKEEKFCLKFVELLNASEAYRQSYNVRPETKPSSIHVAASKLMATPKIAKRIAELQEINRSRVSVTVESITEELMEAQELAINNKSPNALVSALMGKAKLHGLIVDQSKVALKVKKNKNLASLMAEIDGSSRSLKK